MSLIPSNPRIALLSIARDTFDVPLAEDLFAQALQALKASGLRIYGPKTLLYDTEQAAAAFDEIAFAKPDLVLVIQVTFADASLIQALADRVACPFALWAFPEARTGGRLRLNSLCGINLACHALSKTSRPFAFHYALPDASAPWLSDLKQGRLAMGEDAPRLAEIDPSRSVGTHTVGTHTVGPMRVGLIGEHPTGFETCVYDDALIGRFDAKIEKLSLDALFDHANKQPLDKVTNKAMDAMALKGADQLDPAEIEGTQKLYLAMKQWSENKNLDALAVRCWPEMFIENKCAACGAMAQLNDQGVPAACEADVLGSITSKVMQRLADNAPVLLVDLVEVNALADTAVVWHCGLAPLSMCADGVEPEATVHSNRKMALLHQFALKPGRVTFARISQARGELKLFIATGQMLDEPRSYGGTAGVVRFDAKAGLVLSRLLNEGMEHHSSFVYADIKEPLRAWAAGQGLPVVDLSA